MSILLLRMWASTALEHSLSMTLSAGACSIVLGGHGTDKDSIEVINVGHKYVLHVAE
jgi:hypothetical protein